MNDATVAAVVKAAIGQGLVLANSNADGSAGETHVPLTLQPVPVTERAYTAMMNMMPLWNKVVDRAARRCDWLLAVLEGSDAAFTGRMTDIYRRVYASRPPSEWEQSLMLGILRSDYLIADCPEMDRDTQQQHHHDHDDDGGIDGLIVCDAVDLDEKGRHPFRQVEFNTIAAAFPASSTRVGRVHASVLNERLVSGTDIEVSDSEDRVVDAMAIAHREWTARHGQGGVVAAVVFVVMPGERNTGDQALLTAGLRERVGSEEVQVLRRSLDDIGRQLSIDPGTKNGSVLDDAGDRRPVSLFYFRSGYDLEHFGTDAAWDGREQMERCTAIKCPSLPYHLCTWKRVQHALWNRDTLRSFVDTDAEADALLECMVPQYLLHNTTDVATMDAVQDAITRPDRYLVKTQREGAGLVVSGKPMVDLLSIPEDDERYSTVRHEHLLMRRIHARVRPGFLLRAGVATSVPELVAEVSSYGTVLSDGSSAPPILNTAAGYVVRTKANSESGGGIMSGISCLDTLAVVRQAKQ